MELDTTVVEPKKIKPADSIWFKRVLTLDEACQYLGYAKRYVYKLTSAGILPFSKPNGKSIFFDREKLEEWMLQNPKTSLAEKQVIAATHVKTKGK